MAQMIEGLLSMLKAQYRKKKKGWGGEKIK
jgi:hypothetical protein